MDEAPVGFAGHGVGVAPAEEADVVGFFELFEGAGVVAELAVVELDGADVLPAAVDGFEFAVAAEGLGDAGGGDREDEEDEEDGDDDGDEGKAGFGVTGWGGVGEVRGHGDSWVSFCYLTSNEL